MDTERKRRRRKENTRKVEANRFDVMFQSYFGNNPRL